MRGLYNRTQMISHHYHHLRLVPVRATVVAVKSYGRLALTVDCDNET